MLLKFKQNCILVLCSTLTYSPNIYLNIFNIFNVFTFLSCYLKICLNLFQSALLQLREKALVEKTKAELEWLEQQKHRMRNKGADDSYPNIVKRQRGLKMKLQEQKVCLLIFFLQS